MTIQSSLHSPIHTYSASVTSTLWFYEDDRSTPQPHKTLNIPPTGAMDEKFGVNEKGQLKAWKSCIKH